MQTLINTRADLDAMTGTPAHDAFMSMLAGTLYRLEKDDAAASWRAIEDDTTIASFGFVRADFPNAVAPELPVYVGESVEQLIATINKQRDNALGAGFTHNGFLYHCDPTFQMQLQAFLLAWTVGMLAPTATVAIRRYDNVTETMTKDQVGALAGALMAYVQGVYAASWQAKDALA